MSAVTILNAVDNDRVRLPGVGLVTTGQHVAVGLEVHGVGAVALPVDYAAHIALDVLDELFAYALPVNLEVLQAVVDRLDEARARLVAHGAMLTAARQ